MLQVSAWLVAPANAHQGSFHRDILEFLRACCMSQWACLRAGTYGLFAFMEAVQADPAAAVGEDWKGKP